MKATIINLVMFASIMSTQSQDMKTILGTGKSKVKGAYGAASQKFSSIDGQFASLFGGYGGILFNHDFLLGAGASYRFAAGERKFSAPSANISLKLGKF